MGPPSPMPVTVLGYALDNLLLSRGPGRQEGHGKNPSVSICRIPERQKPDPARSGPRCIIAAAAERALAMHY